ncbi:MAG TPA: GTPase ObgE [Pirellulaceae bacterium]|nr:GTPase ObgE [Pirellulaceae bacterium]
MFVDRVTIEVQGGRGGNGCVSFRREKYVPHGGPDGGDGGEGGSVIVVAKNGVNNLAALAHHRFWRAESGLPGSGANKQGKSAHDLVIEVPPGTLIVDSHGGFVLKDLTQDGETVTVARGGAAGRGNAHFKTATNRAPRDSTPGGEGERRELVLELKVIADVGLIGKPNAGKSTLLSRLTRARPQIADYPFTTKHPNLGLVRVDGDRQFVMADIPGLIEGAHAGAGLGHEFLRHIERAGILVHLVEPLPADGSDPLVNYRVIRDELTQYDARLAQRPEILVVSKAELPGAADLREQLAAASGQDVLLISAVTGQGLNTLVERASGLLVAQLQAAP